LKNEAPRYVHLLPELPRLLHRALQPPAQTVQTQRMLEALLLEQRRSNRWVQAVVYVAVGFLGGLLAVQALTRLH
jgi:ubiquinone biosynthesis protein